MYSQKLFWMRAVAFLLVFLKLYCDNWYLYLYLMFACKTKFGSSSFVVWDRFVVVVEFRKVLVVCPIVRSLLNYHAGLVYVTDISHQRDLSSNTTILLTHFLWLSMWQLLFKCPATITNFEIEFQGPLDFEALGLSLLSLRVNPGLL